MIGRRVVLDQRGGRPPRWTLLPEGVERLMRVPETMRKSVVFLYCTVNGQMRPAGTGFLTGYPIPGHQDSHLPLLMTAQHVIAGIQLKSDDGKVLVRFNTQSGEGALFESHVADWEQARSDVDCAYLFWYPERARGGDHVFWSLGGGMATDEVIRAEAIGLGDEVFMVGLFRNYLGRDRNEPIVRVGNIAAMPTDPIRSRHFGNIRVILIEARSIGGLSGSPVFVHKGFPPPGPRVMTQDYSPTPFIFLGLMHGHWEVLEAEADSVVSDASEGKINTGIGLVVPAEQILSAIQPKLEAIAQVKRNELDAANEPVLDEAIEAPSEFERFENLTRKLVNVPKKELDEKRHDVG